MRKTDTYKEDRDKACEKSVKHKMTGKEVVREILGYVKVIVLSLSVTWLVCSKIVTQAQVPTGSMEDTIDTGSRIILNRVAYLYGAPERGDIIAFALPDDESRQLLKRIIGMPGEIIMSREGKVYIDGVVLEEPYLKEDCRIDFGPYEIPENCYFMMGDNRNNSWDSRFWNNKFVDRENITGKAELEFYPEFKVFH